MDNAFDRGPSRPSRAPVAPGPGAAPSSTVDIENHETSFLVPIERVFSTLRRMASDYAQLVVMDVRRAAIQLAWLVGAGILISVLAVTAWLALVVAFAVWLFGQGMSWPSVLAIAAVLNLVGAGLVIWRVKGVFQHSPFSATLRQLKSAPVQGEKEP
ncbi:MAG TPA: phage holin family protein [Burkholderiales bacterium]